MIVVTGAAGFIGSCLISKLLASGYNHIVVVDDFSKTEKDANLAGKEIYLQVDRNSFFDWLNEHHSAVDFIFHIGARTDTTEFNVEVFNKLNLEYSKEVFRLCTLYIIPLVYASSAATYGLGEYGYIDDHAIVNELKPLNPYGESKNEADKWILQQKHTPPFWAGMKFFNVYGPNEYHKGRMASVIFHSYRQIKETGSVKLFKSHRPDFKDGEQLRDFVYVKDVVNVLLFMMQNKPASGLYNLGTGKARTFVDLVNATFKAIRKQPSIEFIDTPIDIRDKYQYFTEADIHKLLYAGYADGFKSLEEGVTDYVVNYLANKNYL
ncbi:MAG: ADP-glyceromanno-heptose 6-epimerase [Lentimicrobiaceae bacterium]